MVSTVNIRWGTKFRISHAKGIISKLPGSVRPSLYIPNSDQHNPFNGLFSPFPQQRIDAPNREKHIRYPSVTAIISCTENMETLYLWQKALIKQLGEAGFNKRIDEMLNSSKTMHQIVANLLIELGQKGKITSTPDEILANIHSCVRSLLPLLKTVRLPEGALAPQDCVENLFTDGRLFYTGKFDALIELYGKLTLVDWKKVSEGTKSAMKQSNGSTSASNTIADLYTAPDQISAYIGAINSSKQFDWLKNRHIENGAIIQIFEDGREPNIISIGKDEIEHHYQQYLNRYNEFWYKIENNVGKVVDFVYKPPDDNIRK